MTKINPGRLTAAHRGDVVVFVIGMRINRWRSLRTWPAAVAAMPRMLAELSGDPESGFLGGSYLLGPGTRCVTVIQYWRSTDDLIRYASDPQALHRPAWRSLNVAMRATNGAVGVFHETYRVAGGAHEQVYVNMPTMGLGMVAGVEPVARRGDRAAQRLADA